MKGNSPSFIAVGIFFYNPLMCLHTEASKITVVPKATDTVPDAMSLDFTCFLPLIESNLLYLTQASVTATKAPRIKVAK